MSEREQEIIVDDVNAIKRWLNHCGDAVRTAEARRDIVRRMNDVDELWAAYRKHPLLLAEIAQLRASLKDTTQDRDAYSISLEVADADLAAARQQIADLRDALQAVTDDMDRAGGDRDGMPECPWCRYQDGQPEHAGDCELVKARTILELASAGKAPQ